MTPQPFRRTKYAGKARSKNFYDGVLPLGNLRFFPDEPFSTEEIYRVQKENAMIYFKTVQSKKIIDQLNIDLFQQANFNNSNFIDNLIVNKIDKRLENMVAFYNNANISTSLKDLENNQAELNSLKINLKKLFQEYIKVLKIILNSGMNTVVGDTRIISDLSKIIDDLKLYQQQYNKLIQDDPVNISIFPGVFWKIRNLFRKVNGHILEDEITDTASSWIPSNMSMNVIGNLYVGGQLSSTDNIVFDELVLNALEIEYAIADIGDSQHKTFKKTTLKNFLQDMNVTKTKNFYISEDTYELMCISAIATIQAKASSSNAKKINFKKDVALFDSKKNTIGNFSFNTLYCRYSSVYLDALIGMKNLYELSKAENGGVSNYVNASRFYQSWINMALSDMYPLIFGNNQYLLSNRFGLITFADLFKRYEVYLTWGVNKTADLTKLGSDYKKNILLHLP